jgi:hypothetical protein
MDDILDVIEDTSQSIYAYDVSSITPDPALRIRGCNRVVVGDEEFVAQARPDPALPEKGISLPALRREANDLPSAQRSLPVKQPIV